MRQNSNTLKLAIYCCAELIDACVLFLCWMGPAMTFCLCMEERREWSSRKQSKEVVAATIGLGEKKKGSDFFARTISKQGLSEMKEIFIGKGKQVCVCVCVCVVGWV